MFNRNKPSKHYLRAIELKKEILITRPQIHTHTILANQSMPAKKSKMFEQLLTQVKAKWRDLNMELDELFEKKLTADEIKQLVATEGSTP